MSNLVEQQLVDKHGTIKRKQKLVMKLKKKTHTKYINENAINEREIKKYALLRL